MIENEKYNLAVYHAQQSAEKLLKACLAAEGRICIYKHEIFYFFKEILGDKLEEVDLKILEDNIPELEKEWSTTRYPGWENDHIWIPSEEYKYEYAIDMESRMEIASKVLKKFLKEKHKLEIKK